MAENPTKILKAYDIIAAADRLGYTEQYVRTLIRRGLLRSQLIPIAKGASVTKHIITEIEIQRFKTDTSRRTRRPDGRTKWVAYATFDEMEKILTVLTREGLGNVADLIRPANKIKVAPDWVQERDSTNN